MTDTQPKQSTRQKLLDSAARIFTEKGYANTSVAEICQEAGANIASVNYHFRSKDALYREVLQYTFDQAEALYPRKSATAATAEEQIALFIHSLIRRIFTTETNGNFYKLVSKEMAEPTEASGSLIREIIGNKRAELQELIRQVHGQPAHEATIAMMTHSIISQCLFLGQHEKGRMHHLQRPALGQEETEAFARHIIAFSLAGIKHYPTSQERQL